MGLYFRGRCFKDEFLVGYGGDAQLVQSGNSHYSLQCGNSKYCINAKTLKGKMEGVPLGYYINRPGDEQKSNCKPYYQVSTGLLFVRAKRDIDTEGEWVEILMPYNDRGV